MPLGAARLSLLAYQAAVAAAGRTAITLTAQQQVQVSTAQSKFGGASAYFDGGTDDYILVDHTQFSHAYSDNFTYECWVRLDSLPSLFTMLATGSTRGDYLSIYNKSGTWTLSAAVSNGSSVYYITYNIGSTPSPNTWYHVAIVKDGASLKLFWDGTELTTNNGSSGTMTADKGWNGVSRIGDWASGTNYATLGYIDEVRWSSTARYTGNFTPSTTAFTNDSDTLLLVHMDGANGSTTFTDDNATPAAAGGRTPKTFITVKDPEISTAQNKFGGASALFQGTHSSSGTSDNIRTEAHSDFIFTGDFTWECWVYMIDNGTNDGMAIMSNRGGFNATNLYLQARHLDQKWQWGNSTMGANVTTQTWNYNTWYHVALVRSGSASGNVAFYVNGTSLQTDTDTNTIGSSGFSDYIALGSIYNATTPSFGLNGYIDEVRISTTARYTGSFTPSGAAFTNDDDTVLLMHMDGANGSTTFTDDTVTPLATGGYITDLTVSGTDYRFHVFDSQSTDDFVVSDLSNVDVILIGGGGGGRSAGFHAGAGGGAGQVLLQTSVAVTAQTYTMTVGGGGPGGQYNDSLADGGTTTAFSYSAIGGDPAQFQSLNYTAQRGGNSGNGFSGGSGANSGTNSYDSGGGGAGATQNGDSGFLSSSAPAVSCGTGGDGYDLTSFIGSGNTLALRNSSDIVGLEVARGGNGARDSSSDVTSFGSGANAFYNTGNSDGSNGNGGAIIIRYQL